MYLFSKIHQLQKEKELTEEDEVRLKNDLKSLQLVDPQSSVKFLSKTARLRSVDGRMEIFIYISCHRKISKV